MSLRDALSHRSFATLVGARAVSKLGDSLHEVALVWLVLQRTGDARLVALVVLASTLPNLLLALPAGVVVDRFDRRRVLVGADLVRGVAVLGIPLFGRGETLVPVAVGVAVVVGLVEPFAGPARNATLPRTVPDDQLESANAAFSLTDSLSRTLYVVGGGVVAFVGAYPAFYVDSATFLVSAVVLWTLPAEVGRPAEDDDSESPLAATRSVFADAREGFAYVRSSPVVIGVLLVALLVGALSDPLGIVLPVFTEESLGQGSVTYGALLAALFVGMVVGDLGVGRAGDRTADARELVVVGSLAVGGVALVAAGTLAPRTPAPGVVTGVALGVFGVSLSLATTPLDALLQATVPNEMLGRVSSVLTVIGLIGPPAALAATGPLVEWLGPETVLWLDGLAVVLAAGVVTVPLLGVGASRDEPVPSD